MHFETVRLIAIRNGLKQTIFAHGVLARTLDLQERWIVRSHLGLGGDEILLIRIEISP